MNNKEGVEITTYKTPQFVEARYFSGADILHLQPVFWTRIQVKKGTGQAYVDSVSDSIQKRGVMLEYIDALGYTEKVHVTDVALVPVTNNQSQFDEVKIFALLSRQQLDMLDSDVFWDDTFGY